MIEQFLTEYQGKRPPERHSKNGRTTVKEVRIL
jgi:hypothetical protein